MTDRWRCVAVITLSALRVLPGSCKRTLLSMALNPHRDNESAVTCMTTSSPGTAEDGENCSETWHRDHTVDGVKIIWCAGWKRNNKLWICSPLIRSDDDFTLFLCRARRLWWNTGSKCERHNCSRETRESFTLFLEFYFYLSILSIFFLFKQIWFNFFLFSVFEKETGGRCLPLWYWEVVPDVLLLRTNQSDLKGLLWKVKRVVFSKHTLYIQYFRLSHHQRAHKENWKEHSEGFGFD